MQQKQPIEPIKENTMGEEDFEEEVEKRISQKLEMERRKERAHIS